MKRLQITPQIEARLKNSVGDVPSNIAVFEATALTTLPVSKRGSIYNGAVHSISFLKEMASFLQGEGNFVPLHTLHLQGVELPVGRVFYGDTIDANGVGELRVQFFVTLSDEEGATLAGRLDNGTINEVSVQILPKHLNCSQCGYDYLDTENQKANPWAIYDRTCPNDHTVGVDGVHVLPNGLARFFELSLVSLGAAQGTKIIPASRARLSADNEDLQRLAANGVAPEMAILNATIKQPTTEEESGQMSGIDPKIYAEALSETLILKKDVEGKDNLIKTLKEEVSALSLKVSEFEAVKDKIGQIASLEASNKEFSEFVAEQAKFAATALSLPETSIPSETKAQLAFIKECGVKLHQMFPAGPRTVNNPSDIQAKVGPAPVAFKINK